jgi:hypothetical protein
MQVPPLSLPFRWHFSGKLVAATTDHYKYMSALGNPVYRFGSFELEPVERRLSERGNAVWCSTRWCCWWSAPATWSARTSS